MNSFPPVSTPSADQMCTLTPDQFTETIASLIEAQFLAVVLMLLIMPFIYEFFIRSPLKTVIAKYKHHKGVKPSLATSSGYFWIEFEGQPITAKTLTADEAWYLLHLRDSELSN